MTTPRKHFHSPQLHMPWSPGLTISTTRAAEILGCSPGTILSLIQDGRLEAYKMRKRSNSHYRVIYESVVRITDEWRQETGILPPQSTQAAPTPPTAARRAAPRT